MSQAKKIFTVSVEQNGLRLDAFLHAVGASQSRAKARSLCYAGMLEVNGRISRPGTILHSGDSVVFKGEQISPAARPKLLSSGSLAEAGVSVLFEDNCLCVFHKPAGLSSVTLRSEDPLTLADCIAAYDEKFIFASPDLREAGLVHRLDFHTSGAVIAAKSREVWSKLRGLFSNRGVVKHYLALVEGKCETPRKISTPLKSSGDGKTVRAAGQAEKAALSAETELIKIRADGLLLSSSISASLVEVRTTTGRRHQVRAHLSLLGHPLVGDRMYGSRASLPSVKGGERDRNASGFFLHCFRLELPHPLTGAPLTIDAPDEDSEVFLKAFRGGVNKSRIGR